MNTNSEKSTIHSFTQGMQEAIAKTQAAMLLEVQRLAANSFLSTQ